MKLNLSPGYLHCPPRSNSAEAFIRRMWRWGRFLCMRAFQVLSASVIPVSHSPLPQRGLCLAYPPLEGCWTLTKGEINHIVTAGFEKHNIQRDCNIKERKSATEQGISGRGICWGEWQAGRQRVATMTGEQFPTCLNSCSLLTNGPFHGSYDKNNSVK